MSSDNWNDIYLNGFGCDIDWDCCPVTSGIAIATRAIYEAYAVMTESLGDTKKDGEG